MKTKKILGLTLILGLSCFLSGCKGIYNTTGGEITLTDSTGQAVTIPGSMVAEMAKDGKVTIAELQAAASSVNGSFSFDDVADIQEAPETVTVNPSIETALSVTRMLPIPYADVLATAASGILGIGALWQRRRATVAQKLNASTIKAIDTFRDILDQTNEGEKIQEVLVTQLKSEHQRAGPEVVAAVNKLLDQYYTPNKPRGGIQLIPALDGPPAA